ncbi:hypothetical protein [Actinophytocola glycyrrhizae]|uniref:DUF4190 domain-containing protein n=1 Tax=Actinophytocola glycyrrhizae TaxID=2044873 RepID=A0ABV9RWH2_9PSEU
MTDQPQGSDDVTWELPARDRRGKLASLGLISLGLGVLCWLTPFVSVVVAGLAIACGVVSIVTRREYRIDWTAVVGICLGTAQLFFELVLFAMRASGL